MDLRHTLFLCLFYVQNYSLFFDLFFFLRCKIIYPEINTKEISSPEIKTKRSESGPKRGE